MRNVVEWKLDKDLASTYVLRPRYTLGPYFGVGRRLGTWNWSGTELRAKSGEAELIFRLGIQVGVLGTKYYVLVPCESGSYGI